MDRCLQKTQKNLKEIALIPLLGLGPVSGDELCDSG